MSGYGVKADMVMHHGIKPVALLRLAKKPFRQVRRPSAKT